jgi:predicted transcriptional regulator
MHTIESLLEKEKQVREALTEAENTYKRDSLAIRVELGKLFAKERARSGLSVFQMAVMLGTNRMKVFSVENSEKVPNPFSSQAIADMVKAAKMIADICEVQPIKPIRKGRPVKFKV